MQKKKNTTKEKESKEFAERLKSQQKMLRLGRAPETVAGQPSWLRFKSPCSLLSLGVCCKSELPPQPSNLPCFSSLICQMGVIFFHLIVLLWNFLKFRLPQTTRRQIKMSKEFTLEGKTFTYPQLSQTFGTHWEPVWAKSEQGKWNRWRNTLLTYISF